MTNKAKIKILLVDDHPIVRSGLRHSLDFVSDFEIIGEAESGEEALFLAKKLNPDVIILDIQMTGLDGVETSEILIRNHPDIKIIGLSSFIKVNLIKQLMVNGAKAFLPKDVSAETIIDTIYRVYKGEHIEPLLGNEHSIHEGNNSSINDDALQFELGKQQTLVLKLMTKGLTNPEIAKQLDFSVSTARYHVSSILNKLEASTRSEAVALAIKYGLVSDE